MATFAFYRHSSGKNWSYADLDRLQRELCLEVQKGMPGRVIFSEVSPVITLGKRDLSCDFLIPENDIKKNGVDIYRTDRGGRATYHGPGQWVVFVVEKLENLVGDSKGVRKTVDALLEIALDVCRFYIPSAEVRGGDQVGIWSSSDQDAKKLVSLGIKVEKGVLLHGLCFNGYPTPQSFYGIEPCGLSVAPGYLIEGEGQMLPLADRIKEQICRRFPRFVDEA
jgi:lipoyl(octanoyl) transferase